LNVLGGALEACSMEPMTGFYRDGCCRTGPEDAGRHVVCAVVTRAFLDFTRSCGNDLETPRGAAFGGLSPGDRWCLCAGRWLEAETAGVAPPVVLESTESSVLDVVPLEVLRRRALG